MHSTKSTYTLPLLVVGIGIAVTPEPNAQTYENCNYGLIAGQPQFLTVNNPSSTLVDQFIYTVTGPFDYTTPTLAGGFAYDVEISGRVGLGPLDGFNNATPDAAYSFVNWQNLDLVHVPAAYTFPWVTHWDGVLGRRPSPDVYSTAHIYDYYVEGQNAGLDFSFSDSYYPDNIGSFQVSIYELGSLSSVPDSGSTIYMLGIGISGLTFIRRKL